MWNDIMDFINNNSGSEYAGHAGSSIVTDIMRPEYQPKGELNEIIEECKNKYDAHGMMIFAAICGVPFFAPHSDSQNVLIRCLVGNVDYLLFNDEAKLDEATNSVTLTPGETLYIPLGKWHGASSLASRAVLSMAARPLGVEEATYHWDNLK